MKARPASSAGMRVRAKVIYHVEGNESEGQLPCRGGMKAKVDESEDQLPSRGSAFSAKTVMCEGGVVWLSSALCTPGNV